MSDINVRVATSNPINVKCAVPSSVTVYGAPLTASGQQIRFNYDSAHFKLSGNNLQTKGMVPVGSIIPYQGGYFTDGSNGGFTMVQATANTVAAVNTLLNVDGWYVSDGAALNLTSSPIWTGAGRYLPYLTDDRFLMGDTLAGGIGGANSSAHTHTTSGGTLALAHTHVAGTLALAHTHQVDPPATTSGVPSVVDSKPVGTLTTDAADNYYHKHVVDIAAFTSGAASTEAVTGSTGAASTEVVTGSTGAASATENRPSYLSCLYICRVF